ncbi:MAG TPA: serine/threonine-protein kinase [Streptosporangiaceae bacterium]|nr:serine/threonine-protein kinase [Streptosporangiaceae bacterium]
MPLRRWDPERIGPYAVLGRLGSGSMGQVFLGRSAAGRLVAVKTIRPELAEEAGFRTRFAQEVAAARKVSGVFTASVVEADPEADLPWLATAYVAAPSLSRLVLACGPLPADSVRWLAAGCAEALASIHGAGLVHRDLKPSNVLVAPDGPRVIDFGVARAAERMGRTTSRGAVGTPAYMAPEQARDTREASVASDVYSLGATLLFAATGHPPHSGASVMDVLARLATEEPDLSGLPGELTDLIAACLDRVPRNRPTSTAMLVQLGDFTVAQAGPDEDHPYLPDAAMALIGEYQRSPQFAAQAGPGEEDATSASYTELPASYKPRPRRPLKGAGAPGSGTPGTGTSGAGWLGWVKTHLAWVGWASVGAALVVAGVILGASLTSSSSQTPGPPPPLKTVCTSLGQGSGGPAVCMNRSQGYPDSSFVVEGSGFSPRATLTVKLSELDPNNNAVFSQTSADQPVTGQDGTFKVAFSQLYSGSLQLGLVSVSVTDPSGHAVGTQFMVIPSGAPINGGQPPAG